jgi:hypothetical protein
MKTFVVVIVAFSLVLSFRAAQPALADGQTATTRSAESGNVQDIFQTQATHQAEWEKLKQSLESQLMSSRIKLKETIGAIASAHDGLRSATGRVENSPAILHQAAAMIDDQIQNLELESVAGKARMDAIEKEIVNSSRRAQDQAANDAAVAEMLKVCVVREQQLKSAEANYKTGMSPQEAVNQATAALAEANAQLAMQKERIVAANGGDVVDGLSKEMAGLRIAAAERDAKLNILHHRQEQFLTTMELLDRMDKLEEDRGRYQQEIDQIQGRLGQDGPIPGQ